MRNFVKLPLWCYKTHIHGTVVLDKATLTLPLVNASLVVNLRLGFRKIGFQTQNKIAVVDNPETILLARYLVFWGILNCFLGIPCSSDVAE